MILGNNKEKLSKRDEHFSVTSLIREGFMPQAICDYLFRMGNWNNSKPKNIEHIIREFSPEKLRSTSTVKYDLTQLTWLNKQWLENCSGAELAKLTCKFFEKQVSNIDKNQLATLCQELKTEAKNLKDLACLVSAITSDKAPKLTPQEIQNVIGSKTEEVKKYLEQLCTELKKDPNVINSITDKIKYITNKLELPTKTAFQSLRMACLGRPQGMEINKLSKVITLNKMISKIDSFLREIQTFNTIRT